MKHRILIICPSNKGTIAMCTLNLWKALSRTEQNEVKCILIYKQPDGIAEFDKCDAFIEGKPENGLKRFLKINRQTRWVRMHKHDFKPEQTISTLFNCSAFNVLAGGKDIKTGIFHSPHQQAKALGKINYLVTLFYYNIIFPRLDRLFCVSREVSESIINSFPQISHRKISVVYNAHDIDAVREKSKESISDLKEQEIFASDVFIYVGRFDRNKAPERALQAFIKSDINKSCQLVYIGGADSSYIHELEEIATTHGIEKRVHFLGPKQNPYKYIARSKALVSCSYSEGLPGVIIESLILGVPVVSTNSSRGVWEILSCDDEYGDIESCHETPFGIITPNCHSDSDIMQMSDAMTRILNYREPLPESPFIQQVSFKNIGKQYDI